MPNAVKDGEKTLDAYLVKQIHRGAGQVKIYNWFSKKLITLLIKYLSPTVKQQ